MTPAYERDGIRLYVGDCREVVPALTEPVSAVVTDPPYGLGFMGKDWDHEVPGETFWRVFSDAMLPGGHLLSFGGSRTFHRIAVAIEDAGFETRDTLMWLYGSGFPKSLDVSKAIDATILRGGSNTRRLKQTNDLDREGEGRERRSTQNNGIMGEDHGGRVIRDTPATDAGREWQGWGTALKPAYEPIIMARKPLSGTVAQNVLTHGTGALNIDACRIGTGEDRASGGATGKRVDASEGYSGAWADADSGRDRPTGGRWPSNVILDETAAAQLDQMSGERPSGYRANPSTPNQHRNAMGKFAEGYTHGERGYKDTGGASRFFYVPKASRAERNAGLDGLPERDKRTAYGDGFNSATKVRTIEQEANGVDRGRTQNHHPTVKPLALMRWLLTLVTPPGGTVLDPFVGSGSTLVACAQLGIPAYGIDMNEEYIEIAARRVDHALNERAREEAKPRQLSIAD